MRALLIALMLVTPLAAQHIAASNQSDNTPLNPLAVWEEARGVIIEAEGLHDALSSGEYDFDISADACESIRAQQRSGLPPALPDPITTLGTTTDECEVLLTEEYVKEALHGWQYDFPASSGSDHTVCASGCDFTSLETAIAAAACGDTVTVTANETVNLSTNEITITQHCSEAAPLWIRTSAHANAVFTLGSRVDLATDTALMPRFTITPSDPVFELEPVLLGISSVNTGTDTLTTATHGLSVGDRVFFTSDAPQPLDDSRPYWVLTVPSSTTFTVSKFENAGAATLDLTGSASGSLVLPSSWIRFTGFYLGKNAGDHTGSLIDLNPTSIYHPDARSHHIWFDHLLADGVFNEELRRVVNLSGRYQSVTDSYLTGATDNADSQAILVGGNGDGPVWIENNHLEASGENIMYGGVGGDNLHMNPGDGGTLVAKGNHLYKPTSWKITSLAGTPTTPCVPGEWWSNTSSGEVCSVCDAGGASWTTQGSCALKPNIDFTTKNNFEIKKSTHSINLGNIYENSWADGGSQHGNILTIKQAPAFQPNLTSLSNGPNVTTQNVLLYGEIARKGGMLGVFAVVPTTGIHPLAADTTGIPGNWALWNILGHDIDMDLYDYIDDDPDASSSLQTTGLSPSGISIRHVTTLPPAQPTVGNDQQWAFNSNSYSDGLVAHIKVADSILGLSDVLASGRASGCASASAASSTFTAGPNLWVWTDAAGPDMSSCSAGGAFSETDLDDIGFASWSGGTTPDDFRLTSAGTTNDYRAGGAQDASDGKDLGADIDIVKDLTGGVEAGLLSWSEQYGVAITAVGATTATVEWDRPNAANACNFYLYTDYARTTEHADTVGSNSDAGLVSAGHVTFPVGGNSALTTKTWYWFEIDCPTDSVRMVGSLFTN